jgi:hypothetical protein
MGFLLAFFLMFSSAVMAQTTPSAFPVEHISYVDSANLLTSLEPSHARVAVVFSDGSCLWTSFPTRSCFLFERKLDSHGVEIKTFGWQLLGVDMGFRNLDLLQIFPINTRPTVMFFEDGMWVGQLEPDRSIKENEDLKISWQDELAQRVLEFAKKP